MWSFVTHGLWDALFTRKEPANPILTLESLRETLALIDKKEQYFDDTIAGLRKTVGTEIATGHKNKAVFLLKKVKMYETELQNLYGIKQNLELQKFTIEKSMFIKDIACSIKGAKSTIDAIGTEIDLDATEDTVADITEQMDNLNDLEAIMARPIIWSDEDDESLLRSFQQEHTQVGDQPIKPSTHPSKVDSELELLTNELEAVVLTPIEVTVPPEANAEPEPSGVPDADSDAVPISS